MCLNEKDLENYFLKRIGDDVIVYLDEKKTDVLKGAKLVKFIKLVNKKNILIEGIEKRGMPRALTTRLIELIKDEATFKDENMTEEIAEKIRKIDCCRSVMINFDDEHSTYTLDMEYELSGVILRRVINWDYLTGPLFAAVNESYEKLKEYPSPP